MPSPLGVLASAGSRTSKRRGVERPRAAHGYNVALLPKSPLGMRGKASVYIAADEPARASGSRSLCLCPASAAHMPRPPQAHLCAWGGASALACEVGWEGRLFCLPSRDDARPWKNCQVRYRFLFFLLGLQEFEIDRQERLAQGMTARFFAPSRGQRSIASALRPRIRFGMAS